MFRLYCKTKNCNAFLKLKKNKNRIIVLKFSALLFRINRCYWFLEIQNSYNDNKIRLGNIAAITIYYQFQN